jgi:hypothetical protein
MRTAAATIACWFIDSDDNGESFFVRQSYFLGQNDPYKSLKTSLEAEIDQRFVSNYSLNITDLELFQRSRWHDSLA